MVQRILKLFHREFGSLHKAAVLLAMSAGASSILGLFRDRLLAGTFGADRSLDIYYAAFRIPDFLYVLSLSLASVMVLIPFFLERVPDPSKPEKGRDFLNNIFTFFLIVMVFLILILFFVVPYLMNIIAPGFSIGDQEKLISLTRILLLSPLLIGLSNLFSSVTQSLRRFFIYALSPILYNIGIIIGIAFLYPIFGLNGLVWGVILGASMHFLIQVPGVIRAGFLPKLSFKIDFSEVWKVVRLSFPRSFGLSVNELVLISITAIASVLSAGSIAVFNLSFSLRSVPLIIIGVSYSVAAFPTLARLFVANKKDEFFEHVISATRQIIFWSIPASVLLIVLRAQIVRTIFGHGKFGWADTRLVAASVAIFSLSVTAQALVILFVRAFYAAGKTTKPIVVNTLSSFFIIALSFLLVRSYDIMPFKDVFEQMLRVSGVPGAKMLVLPFAFSAGIILNVIFLVGYFSKFIGKSVFNKIRNMFAQVLLASLLMGVVSYFFLSVLNNLFDMQTTVGIFFQGFVAGVFGIAVWYVVLRAANNRELEEITTSLKDKFWKTPTIAPEPDEL